MKQAKYIDNFDVLHDYGVIMITGGEPTECPDLLKYIREIRQVNSFAPVFLYSGRITHLLYEALPFLDGMHYTLHANSTDKDIYAFHVMQDFLKHFNSRRTFRLYINPRIKHTLKINPFIWNRIERFDWLTEEELYIVNSGPDGLPIDEEMLILREV
jgi:hypothetical protein